MFNDGDPLMFENCILTAEISTLKRANTTINESKTQLTNQIQELESKFKVLENDKKLLKEENQNTKFILKKKEDNFMNL